VAYLGNNRRDTKDEPGEDLGAALIRYDWDESWVFIMVDVAPYPQA
jgi:hypothetical protein